MKILILILLLFELLLLVVQLLANVSYNWDSLKLTTDFYTYPPFNEKFSIIFPTHSKRTGTFKNLLKNIVYGQSKYLDSIFIYWIDRNVSLPPPKLSEYLDEQKTTIHAEIINSEQRHLTDRFIKPKNLTTRTVFVCDDDLNINANILDSLFEMYLSNHFRDFMVGFTPRSCANGYYGFSSKRYNLVLTNGCFLDVSMIDMFMLPKYEKAREWIDQRFNGEDIMMNFVVQENFMTPPIGVNVPFASRNEPSALSKRKTHYQERHMACSYFKYFFDNDIPNNHTRKSIYKELTNLLVEVDQTNYY